MNLSKINEKHLKVINHEIHDTHFSVCVECKKLNIILWFDVSVEDYELIGEWNKYIFFQNDTNDMKIEKFQDNIDMYILVDSIAKNFLFEKSFVYYDDNGLIFRNDEILTK